MSELSFLIMLLLDHKLSPTVKGLIKERIKEIEVKPQSGVPIRAHSSILPAHMLGQSASTIANMLKDPSTASQTARPPATESAPPVAVATTQATAKAMADRQAAILASVKSDPFRGKPEAGRTSPKKF